MFYLQWDEIQADANLNICHDYVAEESMDFNFRRARRSASSYNDDAGTADTYKFEVY